MVISTNSEPPIEKFKNLLNNTLKDLIAEANKKEDEFKKLEGNKLEPKVFEIMSSNAKETPFENTIKLVGGQKFPDIIAHKYFGVEVKTSKRDHWKTTGNSVLESTRVDGIEKIFLLFGKMYPPIEFKYRSYEECLSEVVVTHSPRYFIDMDLEEGNTIFDKIQIPYNILRKKDNPIKPIIDYYRDQLKEGEEVWWIDQEGEESKSLIIKFWNSLSKQKKEEYVAKGMILFPEVFAGNYNQFTLWLYENQSVICPNVRDQFSAGGQSIITWKNKTYRKIPQVIKKLTELTDKVSEILYDISKQELTKYWEGFNKKSIKERWIELVHQNVPNNPLKGNLKEFLEDKI